MASYRDDVAKQRRNGEAVYSQWARFNWHCPQGQYNCWNTNWLAQPKRTLRSCLMKRRLILVGGTGSWPSCLLAARRGRGKTILAKLVSVNIRTVTCNMYTCARIRSIFLTKFVLLLVHKGDVFYLGCTTVFLSYSQLVCCRLAKVSGVSFGAWALLG